MEIFTLSAIKDRFGDWSRKTFTANNYQFSWNDCMGSTDVYLRPKCVPGAETQLLVTTISTSLNTQIEERPKIFTFTSLKPQKLIWTTKESDLKLVVMIEPMTKKLSSQYKADFSRLFTEDDTKDVKFNIDDKEIHAHKFILVVRSPVFKALFATDMKEKQLGVIEIEDVSFEAFSAFLEFLYGEKYDSSDYAAELLYLADKYEVPDLKTRAANDLIDHITKENAVETMLTFDRLQMTTFVYTVVRFIIRNEKVFTSEQKVELQKSHPQLVYLIEFGLSMIEN